MKKEYRCQDCGREMETDVIHPNNPATRVFWHKDGTPDHCLGRITVLFTVPDYPGISETVIQVGEAPYFPRGSKIVQIQGRPALANAAADRNEK